MVELKFYLALKTEKKKSIQIFVVSAPYLNKVVEIDVEEIDYSTSPTTGQGKARGFNSALLFYLFPFRFSTQIVRPLLCVCVYKYWKKD